LPSSYPVEAGAFSDTTAPIKSIYDDLLDLAEAAISAITRIGGVAGSGSPAMLKWHGEPVVNERGFADVHFQDWTNGK
jgi:hypothetical protein